MIIIIIVVLVIFIIIIILIIINNININNININIIINTYSYIMLYHAISCYISTSTAIYIYIDVFFVAQPLVLAPWAPLAPAGWVQALPLGDRIHGHSQCQLIIIGECIIISVYHKYTIYI